MLVWRGHSCPRKPAAEILYQVSRCAPQKTKSPPASGRGPNQEKLLESKLGRQLNAARCTATEERVADAYVASSSELVRTSTHLTTIAVDGKTGDAGIGDEGR